MSWCESRARVLLKSDRVAEDAYLVQPRGCNPWVDGKGLYSAFTNYASYADERNGFGLRNTGKDTSTITMFRRENQAAQWVNSREFKEFAGSMGTVGLVLTHYSSNNFNMLRDKSKRDYQYFLNVLVGELVHRV